MRFFEFFFSGPGWGWKVFALSIVINLIMSGIAKIVVAVFEGKSKFILTQIKGHMDNLNDDSSPATKDDVRS